MNTVTSITIGGGIFSEDCVDDGGGGLIGRAFLAEDIPTGVEDRTVEHSLARFHGDKHLFVSTSEMIFKGDNLLQSVSSFLIMRRIWKFTNGDKPYHYPLNKTNI